jgi:6-phosphofructokinase 1
VRIGVLTAGGDAPGLNAAIRALGRRALAASDELIGVRNGFAGLDGDADLEPLSRTELSGILPVGGTILGTGRHNLDHPHGGRERVATAINEQFDALVIVGGDGSMTVAADLASRGCPVVGVPKTLDNDLAVTEYCIGFDSAVSVVADALDRLHTTAASHHRVMVLETMGRRTGWVAATGGLAGGADYLVIPEFPVTLDAVMDHIERRKSRGSSFSLVVIAEGVDVTPWGLDALAGPGHALAAAVHDHTGYEVRATVLGHLQRGGSPTAFDRVWATRVGAAAYDLVAQGCFGFASGVRDGRLTPIAMSDLIATTPFVPRELYELCATFF